VVFCKCAVRSQLVLRCLSSGSKRRHFHCQNLGTCCILKKKLNMKKSYHPVPVVTRGFCFCCVFQWIGPLSGVAYYKQVFLRTNSNPDPNRTNYKFLMVILTVKRS
jgi:hypothetical protein